MAPYVYLIIKLSSTTKPKPTYKIGELGPTNWHSNHIEDPASRTTKTVVVVKYTPDTAENWNIKVDFDEIEHDSSGSIEAWFHNRDDAVAEVDELQKDIADNGKSKTSWTDDEQKRLKGVEMHVAESGKYVWLDVVEVELEQLEQDRFGSASGYVGQGGGSGEEASLERGD